MIGGPELYINVLLRNNERKKHLLIHLWEDILCTVKPYLNTLLDKSIYPPWFWGLWYEGVIKENRRYDDDTQGHEKLIYTNFHEIRLMYRKDTATVNPKRLDINIYPLRVFGLPTRKTWSNPVQIFVTYLLVYPWYIPKILGQSDLQQGIYEFFFKSALNYGNWPKMLVRVQKKNQKLDTWYDIWINITYPENIFYYTYFEIKYVFWSYAFGFENWFKHSTSS